ncbi:MAG: uroporphyrinogen-III synthase, partial [Peptococcaceae bacterium]|nr:uroporphyrinogen-III synthase [Peptococcaceae bacterium]
RIEELGGQAWEVPAIELEPPTQQQRQRWQEVLRRIKEFQWLIFTSVNGVAYFFKVLTEYGYDIRDLAGLELVAIGPATQAALTDKHLRVSWVPDEYRAEKVVEILAGHVLPGQKILLARAEEARDVLPNALREMGAEVWDIPVYRTVVDKSASQELLGGLREGSVDALTFTSSSTVRNFLALLGEDRSLLQGVKVFTIGPVTSQTAREMNLTVDKEAQVYTIAGLMDALTEGLR